MKKSFNEIVDSAKKNKQFLVDSSALDTKLIFDNEESRSLEDTANSRWHKHSTSKESVFPSTSNKNRCKSKDQASRFNYKFNRNFKNKKFESLRNVNKSAV